MRKFLSSLLLLALLAGAVWYGAGRLPGPAIAIERPGDVIGQATPFEVTVDLPSDRLAHLEIAVEQNGEAYSVFTLAEPGGATVAGGDEGLRISGLVGRRTVPALTQDPAHIVVRAARPVLFGLRTVERVERLDVDVRLVPPQIAVTSLHHFINLGGSEAVLYRVTPADAESGVRVGEVEYPGYPASGAGVAPADPSLKVAFFAVLYDQPADVPIAIFARDAAANEGLASFDHRIFPKRFRQSRIVLDEAFMQRVVPAIIQNTPDFRVDDPDDLLGAYLAVNRDLRQRNNAAIAALAERTEPRILWQGPFTQMVNTAVESGFADHRTYVFDGEEVDRQVHLGFDLASLRQAPVRAANRGRVVHAGYLGIYGNCVVLDHGMGLQSLYAHLTTMDVAEGAMVEHDQQLGTTGVTGLAAGDHLHFTMLLHGHAVTPIDWWSPQWIQDRVLRKLREAAGTGVEPTP